MLVKGKGKFNTSYCLNKATSPVSNYYWSYRENDNYY